MEGRALGKEGEDYAMNWLLWHNYQILARNWRSGRTELDIVASDGKRMVFVEVKTRANDWFTNPESAVDHKKQKSMMKTAMAFMEAQAYDGPFRFDIIAIVWEPHVRKLLHLTDAFFPIRSQ